MTKDISKQSLGRPQRLVNLSHGLDFFILVLTLYGLFKAFIFQSQSDFSSDFWLSPFTCFSLSLMVVTRLASAWISTWSKPMSLALLGIVACGNFSSLWIQWFTPHLFMGALPGIVPTSAMTSAGLILLCFYEILITIRKTPQSFFIVDDILLHLVLFPGGLSLMGQILGVPIYSGASHDPRVGIGFFEMVLMGFYVSSAALSNSDLFLWRFLRKSQLHRLIFIFLFVNQYVVPIFVGMYFRNPQMSGQEFGLEFYVMLAGVLATLLFLSIYAFGDHKKSEELVTKTQELH